VETDHSALDIWVIYDHPRDQPELFVVRRQRALLGSDHIIIDPNSYGFKELETARLWLEQKGLANIGRFDADDPKIVECWI
jgi:hypothetical protein